jgi:hypothetical protein
MKKIAASAYILFSALLAASFALAACASQKPLAPASFDVVSFQATPSQVAEGEDITVTATVTNQGDIPGNFDEPLLVNGAEVAKKVVTLQPGATKTISYTISLDKPGTYALLLYNGNASVSVKAMVVKEAELKYDNDRSKTALWAGNNGGFLIDFIPPSPFRIDKVSICGGIYGVGWEGKTFDLYVLDSDMKSAVYQQTYALSKFSVRSAFPYQPPAWTDFDIPEMTLEGKFYVYLYTSTGEHKGVHMGVDPTVFNEHSQLAQGKPPYIGIIPPGNLYPPTIWYADSTKVNWMIRASGTILAPQ